MQKSELILNNDGSVYHLKLKPEEIVSTIITVGDPDRVSDIVKHFDTIEIERRNREFYTVTGSLGNKYLTVISTGIGTDNIDIVLNELDALFNVNLSTLEIKELFTPLTIIRIGTSGSIKEDIPVDSFVVSAMAIGLDGLMHNYKAYPTEFQKDLHADLMKQSNEFHYPINPYVTTADSVLLEKFKAFMIAGITLTAGGFYAPQGRNIRMEAKEKSLIDQLRHLKLQGYRMTNFEMETAGIYGLSEIMGHRAISLNAILANRISGNFSTRSKETMEMLISKSLETITSASF
jgi:uridine phosphorylase